MGRPKKADLSLKERLERMEHAGLSLSGEEGRLDSMDQPAPLPERIHDLIYQIERDKLKFDEMIYLVMYDIENDRVRREVAKYLLQKGCVRIQKSVYLARTKKRVHEEIADALKDIQSFYENEDSMIVMPVTHNAMQSMSIIGKDIQIEHLIDPPNTVFI